MNAAPARVVIGMLAIAVMWAVYTFGSHYSSCRGDGTGKVACFFVAMFSSCLEAFAFIIFTVVKVITLVMP